MKFLDIINEYNQHLNEQDSAGLQGTDTAGDPQNATPNNIDEPAGIATMGNLLKKALTLKINDGDRYKISQLPEINEKNASDIIDQLISIMKTYSVDIDIDNNQKTSI